MRAVAVRWAAVLLAGCGVGCATASRPSADLWVASHGGVLPARTSDQARIEAVAKPLIAACTSHRITVQVLATDVVSAYSLYDGHVFVTRGLMTRLTDAELQAAVAHELGHLLSDGRLKTIASLNGCCVDPDREVRADAVGAQLLQAEGLAPATMLSMLKKVEQFGSLSATCALAVHRRIAILSASLHVRADAGV